MSDVTPLLNDTLYNRVRQLAEFVLPAAATLYFTLASIWGFPYGEEVVGTIAAINLFMGALVLIGRRQYNQSDAAYDGQLKLMQHPDGSPSHIRVVAEKELEQLEGKGEARLQVVHETVEE